METRYITTAQEMKNYGNITWAMARQQSWSEKCPLAHPYFSNRHQHTHAHAYTSGTSVGVLKLIFISTTNHSNTNFKLEHHMPNFLCYEWLHTIKIRFFFTIFSPPVPSNTHTQLTIAFDVLILTHVSPRMSCTPSAYTHE